MNHRRTITVAVVAMFSIVGTFRFVWGASSFLGQGTVPFTSIKVGTKDSDKIILNGTISNTRKNKPLRIVDNVQITGNLDVTGIITGELSNLVVSNTASAANLKATEMTATNLSVSRNATVTGTLTGGTTNVGALTAGSTTLTSLSVTGTNGVTVTNDGKSSFLNGAGITTPVLLLSSGVLATPSTTDSLAVTVADELRVTRNLTFNGSLYAGSTNYSSRIDDNKTATNAMFHFIQCVHSLSQVTGYVESDHFADCWNIWIAGKVSDPAVP